jgi:hypothetical protein
MVKKIYVLGLTAGARQAPAEVTKRVWEALNSLDMPVTPVKTTRAGAVVVEADEELASRVREHDPALFVEEQQYLRRQ